MSPAEFAILYGGVLVTMLACRCLPLFVLKGRELSDGARKAIGLIPPAAFAALVANDVIRPDAFARGLLPGLLPVVAALPVLLVARKTGSLIWCALLGMACYALLLWWWGVN
ncbi:MAG: AzlD domain-containing protein [Coriobacteriales bacterium]|nr:AzlD domain-containing protein [Coriobacteriales bacterium]